MAWLQLKFQIAETNAENASALLTLLGAVAVTFEDAADQPVLEPAPGATPLWQHTVLKTLLPENAPVERILSFLSTQFFSGENISHTLELLEEENWERAWMKDFHPMHFGGSLWICPSNTPPPDPSAVNIILDPGLAFGTGTHPTTALCLNWLATHDIKNKTIIDYGCGSGILAIAALKLGAREVWAIDYDPQALEATQDNAARNQIDQSKLHILAPENFSGSAVDIMLANILANPIIALAPRFTELVKPQGNIVLSGILEDQMDAVVSAYQSEFQLETPTIQEGWVRIDGVRKTF